MPLSPRSRWVRAGMETLFFIGVVAAVGVGGSELHRTATFDIVDHYTITDDGHAPNTNQQISIYDLLAQVQASMRDAPVATPYHRHEDAP